MTSMDNIAEQQHKSCVLNPVSKQELNNLHNLGFKLTLLRQDSQTPNVCSTYKDDDYVSGIGVYGTNKNGSMSLKELFLKIPDELFYTLLRIRLKLPVLEESKQVCVEYEREYYVNSFTIDQLFKEISSTVEIVAIGGKEIKVRKYYNRALKILKFVNLTKQDLEFVINISDLSPRIIAELKTLDKIDGDYVLKQAVGGIFENINSKRYHNLGFAKRLGVRLDR